MDFAVDPDERTTSPSVDHGEEERRRDAAEDRDRAGLVHRAQQLPAAGRGATTRDLQPRASGHLLSGTGSDRRTDREQAADRADATLQEVSDFRHISSIDITSVAETLHGRTRNISLSRQGTISFAEITVDGPITPVDNANFFLFNRVLYYLTLYLISYINKLFSSFLTVHEIERFAVSLQKFGTSIKTAETSSSRDMPCHQIL